MNNEIKPEELARETLQTLKLFTGHLISLSYQAAQEPDSVQSLKCFQRLLDGIQTFVDTVSTTKAVLQKHHENAVNILEADLLSILKDMLEAENTGDAAYRRDLLLVHLPKNLEDWRDSGIEKLIQ